MRDASSICERQELSSGQLRRPVRILVVDDYPDNVASMAMLLRLYGHEVDTASGGSAAVAAALARPPDVVLLDISMPGMDGYEVARRLRGMFGDRVTLIAITVYGSEEDRQHGRAAGFDRHLIKPADPQKLEQLLRELAKSLSDLPGEPRHFHCCCKSHSSP